MHKEYTKEEEEAFSKMFFEELERVEELLESEGNDIGLCPHCKDTGYMYLQEGEYSGIQARKENGVVLFNECFHGDESIDELF